MQVVYLARALDGLVLAETWDEATANSLHAQKRQAKEVLRQLRQAPTNTKFSVDVDAQCQFHYFVDGESGVVFMVLSNDKALPKRLVFAFLEEVKELFMDELRREFGSGGGIDYRSRVETIEKAYYFVRFDRAIARKKASYRNRDQSALSKLETGLGEVTDIMQQSLADLMVKGENLADVGRRGESLRDASKEFSNSARMLSLKAMLRQYALVGGIAVFVLFIFWIKLF